MNSSIAYDAEMPTESEKLEGNSEITSIEASSLASPRNVLDDLHQVQVSRCNRLLKPFSSPLKGSGSSPSSRRSLSSPVRSDDIQSSPPDHLYSPIKGHYNKTPGNGHQGVINSRNKHNQLHAMRLQHKQHKLQLQRNRIYDLQSNQDENIKYLQQANELDIDIDTLIEEERDIDAIDNAYVEQYENELDEYELQEELEIAEMLNQLDLKS